MALGRQSELGELPVVTHIQKIYIPSDPRASRTPDTGGPLPEPSLNTFGFYFVCWQTPLCAANHISQLNKLTTTKNIQSTDGLS